MNRYRWTIALALVTMLALTACGRGVAPELPDTVVDIASDDADFSTLVTALAEADLVDTLSGDGPFTVFAPTNDAFAAALDELDITADELLARDDLADILSYHVVPGRLLAADLIEAVQEGGGTATLATVQGAEVTLAVDGGAVVLDERATVVSTDLEADNGVVHVIDAVLLPPAE